MLHWPTIITHILPSKKTMTFVKLLTTSDNTHRWTQPLKHTKSYTRSKYISSSIKKCLKYPISIFYSIPKPNKAKTRTIHNKNRPLARPLHIENSLSRHTFAKPLADNLHSLSAHNTNGEFYQILIIETITTPSSVHSTSTRGKNKNHGGKKE